MNFIFKLMANEAHAVNFELISYSYKEIIHIFSAHTIFCDLKKYFKFALSLNYS